MRFFLLIMMIIIWSCKSPVEPVGINVTDEWHFETVDACRGIDASNGVLVAAASSNGYYRFDIVENNGSVDTLNLVYHNPDINPQVGDDAAYDVIISNNISDMAFILDDVDNIIVDFFEGGVETLSGCGNSLLYRSLTLNDDIADTTILFTLQKHFDVVPDDFDLYSTSVGVREFYTENIFGDDFFTETGCDAVLNPNIEAMKVFYADNLLSITNGGMGVQVWRYNHNPGLDTDLLENLTTFYVQGGEAESIYSKGNYVIGGFDNDRGCYMALLDSNGDIIDNLSFADGYSINAIDYDSGVLALSAGNDGIIIYEWSETLSLKLKGILDVGEDNYVYDIKVINDNIFVASENGISIYKIRI